MVFKEDKLANPFRRILPFLSFFIIIAFLSGCGGGGGSSEQAISGGGGSDGGGSEPFPAKILTWIPPSQYTDGAQLNPVTDLDRFEIYINEDGLFADTDTDMAEVSATVPGTGQPTTSFDLSNLAPFLSRGVTYHVSIRAVALSGLKSDFSPDATFSF